ncbi:MAG: DUF882 domain-containing protein [Rhizobiales bacterium]|nr:DUF882 domain-containing protein [Hyphomicrobiales bacterium]
MTGTSSLQNAVANGDTRTLNIEFVHTGESGSFTFKRDGRYDQEVLKKLSWLLRDWRKSEPTEMDPELFDLVWEVYREVDAKDGIKALSGYRSPSTNAMLRARSKAVAEQSQHTHGRAMDFYMPGVNLTSIRVAGLQMQRGGVGFYPGNNFVHLDTGSIRHWPRMTHDQLVRVFPDEKTVHVPSDGKPLARYQEALAELEGSRRTVEIASNDAGEGIRRFFASLFSFKKSTDEEEESAPEEVAAPKVAARTKPTAPQPDEAPASASVRVASAPPSVTTLAAAPLPTARPAEIAAAIVATQAVVAPLTNVPLPLRRPAAPVDPVVVASIGPVPLPAVITRGTQGQSSESLLSYAPAAADLDPGRPLTQSMVAAPALQRPKGKDIPFGRLFVGPVLTGETFMRLPELRVFASFMAPPKVAVANTFSADATAGLSTSRFSGEAMANVPVYVFAPSNVRVTQRVR